MREKKQSLEEEMKEVEKTLAFHKRNKSPQGCINKLEEYYQKLKNTQKNQGNIRQKTNKITASNQVIINAYKSVRDVMALPMFSTDQKIRTENIEYNCSLRGKDRYVKVMCKEVDVGIANQGDADIIRFAISKIGAARNITGDITNTVEFTRYEILKALGKGTSKREYEWLKSSIKRIGSTTYETNIWTDKPNDYYFGTLASFYITENEKKQIDRIQMVFCDPLYQHMKKNQILTIHEAIMKDSGYLKKKIIELAQVYMGKDNYWKVSLDKFREMCAYRKTNRRIRADIKRMKIPYQVEFSTDKISKIDLITFFKNQKAS